MVPKQTLKNKPLIEAIFELRWKLIEKQKGMFSDPHYRILIGSIYEKVKNEYGYSEQLPTATMPDEISGYVVQHRFRKGENQWPLIQLGPGIITLNDTSGYDWEDFEKRISELVNHLFGSYPKEDDLNFHSIQLRYIDAIPFDFQKDDIFSFLKDKMKIDVEIHKELFKNTGVIELPQGIDFRLSYLSSSPKGAINLRFGRGQIEEKSSLVWETTVQSIEKDVPSNKEGICTWVNMAHELADDWFFKIIEGELLRRFS